MFLNSPTAEQRALRATIKWLREQAAAIGVS
jgi:hypothetical protein